MTGTPWTHTPVLLSETIDALLSDPSGTYIDATYGRGGHTRLLLSRLSPRGRLIALDRDPQAVADAAALAAEDTRFRILHAPFGSLQNNSVQVPLGSITGILLDLGISSPQVDDATRGFSFMRDGPLDMRMDPSSGISVAQWLANATLIQIQEVLNEYSDERRARAIATAIVASREKKAPIQSTADLVKIVASAVRGYEAGQHPATRTFQALRIHINDELGELERALNAAPELLRQKGRLAVITFHSIEDRIVKQFIVGHSKEVFDPRSPQKLLRSAPASMPFKDLGRIKASTQEVKANPRSRSATLRVAEKN